MHGGAKEPPLLDPDALTIGFARRFATYKRAVLIFTDRDRLKALLVVRARPLHDLEQTRHLGDLLDLLLHEPVHELL